MPWSTTPQGDRVPSIVAGKSDLRAAVEDFSAVGIVFLLGTKLMDIALFKMKQAEDRK